MDRSPLRLRESRGNGVELVALEPILEETRSQQYRAHLQLRSRVVNQLKDLISRQNSNPGPTLLDGL